MDIPEELAMNYLRRRLMDLESLEQALLQHNYKSCEEIGHRLKGSARTFGFQDLEQIARVLESNASKEDDASLLEDVMRFKIWLDKYIH